MNKVDKNAALCAGKQGQKALVSWLSGFTAWDLRQARGELSRWDGQRPWQVSGTLPVVIAPPESGGPKYFTPSSPTKGGSSRSGSTNWTVRVPIMEDVVYYVHLLDTTLKS